MSALYKSVPVPGEREVSTETLASVAKRAQSEYHLFVDEDYGWREWLWFPGLGQDEFAHWWVSEATSDLRGEFFPAFGPLWDIAMKDDGDEEQLTLRIDGVHNTYLELHPKYEATLIPRFAWTAADPSNCSARGASNIETIKRWWRSIALTQTASPDAYLWAYKNACVEMKFYPGAHPLPKEVEELIEVRGGEYVTRDWSELSALLPLPFFDQGTRFWEVNGEPYWGSFRYESALSEHVVTDSYMHDEGRQISEKEFLFLLSFCPKHRVPGIPAYTARDGLVPDQLAPTNTYWLLSGALAAVSQKGFVKCWPNRGLISADEVRTKGESISELEFRRHYAAYASR